MSVINLLDYKFASKAMRKKIKQLGSETQHERFKRMIAEKSRPPDDAG